MEPKNVNILGTEYTLSYCSENEDSALKQCDGYCDKSTKKIVVTTENGDLGDFHEYQKKVVRHEIIHAYLHESGLSDNWEHKNYGQEETVVDWMSIQFPKIMKTFMEVGCL